MFLNSHACDRLRSRLPDTEAGAIIARLESEPGVPGLAAYVLGRVAAARGDCAARDSVTASNGDTIVAVARDGEVVTIFYRRSWNQRLDAEALGVAMVFGLRLPLQTLACPVCGRRGCRSANDHVVV